MSVSEEDIEYGYKMCKGISEGTSKNYYPMYTHIIELYEQRAALAAANERLKRVLDNRLCEKHQKDTGGKYSYEYGEGITKTGGGCAVCIGCRVDRENENLKENYNKMSINYLGLQDLTRRLVEELKPYEWDISHDEQSAFCRSCHASYPLFKKGERLHTPSCSLGNLLKEAEEK